VLPAAIRRQGIDISSISCWAGKSDCQQKLSFVSLLPISQLAWQNAIMRLSLSSLLLELLNHCCFLSCFKGVFNADFASRSFAYP